MPDGSAVPIVPTPESIKRQNDQEEELRRTRVEQERQLAENERQRIHQVEQQRIQEEEHQRFENERQLVEEEGRQRVEDERRPFEDALMKAQQAAEAAKQKAFDGAAKRAEEAIRSIPQEQIAVFQIEEYACITNHAAAAIAKGIIPKLFLNTWQIEQYKGENTEELVSGEAIGEDDVLLELFGDSDHEELDAEGSDDEDDDLDDLLLVVDQNEPFVSAASVFVTGSASAGHENRPVSRENLPRPSTATQTPRILFMPQGNTSQTLFLPRGTTTQTSSMRQENTSQAPLIPQVTHQVLLIPQANTPQASSIPQRSEAELMLLLQEYIARIPSTAQGNTAQSSFTSQQNTALSLFTSSNALNSRNGSSSSSAQKTSNTTPSPTTSNLSQSTAPTTSIEPHFQPAAQYNHSADRDATAEHAKAKIDMMFLCTHHIRDHPNEIHSDAQIQEILKSINGCQADTKWLQDHQNLLESYLRSVDVEETMMGHLLKMNTSMAYVEASFQDDLLAKEVVTALDEFGVELNWLKTSFNSVCTCFPCAFHGCIH